MRFLPFLTLLLACSTSTTAANSPAEAKTEAAPATVVASWTGGEVSSNDLDESISTELTKLKAEYVTSSHEARQQGLDALIGEKVLEAEAKKRGLDGVEALLKVEINDKVKPHQTKKSRPSTRSWRVAWVAVPRGGSARHRERDSAPALAERFEAFMGEMHSYAVKIVFRSPRCYGFPSRSTMIPRSDPRMSDHHRPVRAVPVPVLRRAKEVIDQVMEKYEGKVRMVYRDFPLSFHDRAIAAIAANCAAEQGQYWPMYDAPMSNRARARRERSPSTRPRSDSTSTSGTPAGAIPPRRRCRRTSRPAPRPVSRARRRSSSTVFS